MHRKILTYSTGAKSEIRTITGDLRRCVAESGVRDGCLLAYSLHTTLGLMVQETAETHLCEDVLDYLGFVIEEDGELYKHRGHLHPRSNGDDTDCNAPSHLRQILVNQNVLLDVHDGELALGTWQDVAIAEFDGPRAGRNVLVKVWEDPSGETKDWARRAGAPRRAKDEHRKLEIDDWKLQTANWSEETASRVVSGSPAGQSSIRLPAGCLPGGGGDLQSSIFNPPSSSAVRPSSPVAPSSPRLLAPSSRRSENEA
jgi:secondary thiamine-phosphate synthase enzyme